jgi:hypothetical protein
MSDHDQRFKTLLYEFLPEFLRLFFPEWAERFDCATAEWLDKEAFPDPPQGQRREIDLVARVATRQPIPPQRPGRRESTAALIHIEIEAEDRVALLRGRIYDYHKYLSDRHGLPVLSIGLYLRVGLDGVGVDRFLETFLDFPQTDFRFLYAGLPALDAERYVAGENLLGVALAALMRIPAGRRPGVKAEALRRIQACTENVWRKYLLWECVPLAEDEQQAFDRLLDSEPFQGVKVMATATWYEQARREGFLDVIRPQLEERFGPLSPAVLTQLETIPLDRLAEIGRAVLKAKSLQELGLEGNGQGDQGS